MTKDLQTLIELLNGRNDIDGWLINETSTDSHEFFFIAKKLDMNRTKTVEKIQLTVYKDFENDGSQYKGSASTTLPPALEISELTDILDDLIFAACYVKNADYQLVQKQEEKAKNIPCNLASKDPMTIAPKIIEAMYSQDVYDEGRINSVELFLEQTSNHLMNSEGVDQNYTAYYGEIELIVDWQAEGKEAVELFNLLQFSDVDYDKLKDFVKDALTTAKLRAEATPLLDVPKIPILLTRTSVPTFFEYFTAKSSAEAVYQKYSSLQVGQAIQGDTITGDAVTLKLKPIIPGSPSSRAVDGDGVLLSDILLYDNGVLKQYHGSNRYAQYLGVPITGHIPNVEISGGKHSEAELREEPYLELIAFSDFQMNEITGDFGGEIRLAKYVDKGTTHYLTGGSISANFKQVAPSMLLSKETQQIGSTICPKVIKLFDVSLASAE